MKSKTLEGIRILDLSSGPVGGIATMILSDFGAEVLTIERPGGDPYAHMPAARMWRRGKTLLTLDLGLSTDLDKLNELCAAADVLVCNWRAGALSRKNLDFDSLHQRHPHLIFCHITGFGGRGPLADLPGYEHLVAAYSGRMQVFAGIVDREGPVFSALQVGVHACAQSATAGILAALLARGKDGPGRLVEASMLQGMLPYEMGPMIGVQVYEHFPELLPVLQAPSHEPPMPSLFYHPAQAGDGRWMQFGNLLPHLFDNFLIVSDLIDIVTDPDFNPRQLSLPRDKHEAFRERMLSRIQQRSAEAWMVDFVADGGVVAAPYQTTQEALSDPDIIANGHIIKRPDGSLQLGPLARLAKTPAVPGADAKPDEGGAARWCETPRKSPANHMDPGPGAQQTIDQELPLAGIRVVELATIIAAPLGTSFLADMGADVIKVEQIGGDPFRGMLSGLGYARVNPGKRSISVDLKSAAGQKIVLDLVRDADVVVHNFRPGVPERLGIGYAQISAINPAIIYLQCNGYGPDGPGALRPSTHPIPGAAMGGVMYQMGERLPKTLQDVEGLRLWTRRIMRANEVNPDPNTALVVTTSIMLGLVARQRTEEGQQIFIDMFGANAYANSDDFLSYPGKPKRAMPDEQLLGLSATYQLYSCANEQWVFLALTNKDERGRFIDVLSANGIPALSAQLLAADSTETRAALTELFALHDADFWQCLMVGAGIGCVRANGNVPSEFWLSDSQADALDLTVAVEHPLWGNYRRHGPMALFDGKTQALSGPPLSGQHNNELLLQSGYDAEHIKRLESEGILWQEKH